MRTMRSLRRRNTYRHLRADYCLRRDLLPHAADRVANAVLAGAAGCEFKRPLAWLASFARRPRTRRRLKKSARRGVGRVLTGTALNRDRFTRRRRTEGKAASPVQSALLSVEAMEPNNSRSRHGS